MFTVREVEATCRGLLVVLAALLPLSMSCADSTQPVEPAVVGGPAAQPAPPPVRPAAAGPEHIYLANADGSVTARLTRGGWPAWSPDGGRIAFQRDSVVHVINADGSNELRLTAGTSPAWSPDGARIVFTSSEGISVMNADGAAVRTLVRHDFRDDTYAPWDMGVGEPAWSPDGERIAFAHQGDGDTQPGQIFVMSSDGSAPRLLTTSSDRRRWAEYHPSWSPDGATVVFWSYGHGIAVVGRNGGEPSGIAGGTYGARPVWSPDGRTLALTRDRHSPAGAAIVTWSMASGAKVLIPNGYDAAWSPDGARIAFVSTRGQ